MTRLMQNLVMAAALVAMMAGVARAADVHSNGKGGGNWSDASSWRGGKPPGVEDTAVISRGDTVAFDRDDAGKTTVKQIQIDPAGVLTFKVGAGKTALCVGGIVECYGTIRIDSTKLANDTMELRLVSAKAEERLIALQQGGTIVVNGREGLPDGRRNAVISSLNIPPPPPEVKPPPAPAPADPKAAPAPAPAPATPAPPPPPEVFGRIKAAATNTMDIQNAAIVNVVLSPSGIDNTGAKPNERMVISGNRFTGLSRVEVVSCDTPTIADNVFEGGTVPPGTVNAIYVNASPLAEIKGNTVKGGGFAYGIQGYAQTDSVVSGNTISDLPGGVYWYGTNAMIKGNLIRNCTTGIIVTSMSGTIEETRIEGSSAIGVHVAGATLQLTSVEIAKTGEKGVPVSLDSGTLSLVNCNLKPDQIKLGTPPAGPTWVDSIQFVVAQVRGVPVGTQVNIKSNAPVAANAMDLNVRNAPAMIRPNGMTPLPETLGALMVRNWSIGKDKAVVPPPAYTLIVSEPPKTDGTDGKVLKTVSITPAESWFRAKPNEPKATVEVSVP